MASKRENGYGLHDMSGNVWEWTLDEYKSDYKGASSDGHQAVGVMLACETKCDNGLVERVTRGGSWYGSARDLRVTARDGYSPDHREGIIGLRLRKMEAATKIASFVVDAKLAAQGKALFTSKTCSACHSVDGARLVGPTMKGIWGRKEKMTDGTELYVDEAYFARSIKEPMAQVVEGFPPAMRVLPVSDDEIKALLHYVVSIK